MRFHTIAVGHQWNLPRQCRLIMRWQTVRSSSKKVRDMILKSLMQTATLVSICHVLLLVTNGITQTMKDFMKSLSKCTGYIKARQRLIFSWIRHSRLHRLCLNLTRLQKTLYLTRRARLQDFSLTSGIFVMSRQMRMK